MYILSFCVFKILDFTFYVCIHCNCVFGVYALCICLPGPYVFRVLCLQCCMYIALVYLECSAVHAVTYTYFALVCLKCSVFHVIGVKSSAAMGPLLP